MTANPTRLRATSPARDVWLDVAHIVDYDATAVAVHVGLPDHPSRSFVASSKRHPRDPFDATVGAAIALSRALQDAADWLETVAAERIDMNCRIHDTDGDLGRLIATIARHST